MKPIHASIARIRDQMGRILLLKRKPEDRAFQGWCLPGGRRNIGETPIQALCREVFEETGLTILSCTLLFTREAASPNGDTFMIDCFDAKAVGEVTISSEHEAWQYISFAEACRINLDLSGRITSDVMSAP